MKKYCVFVLCCFCVIICGCVFPDIMLDAEPVITCIPADCTVAAGESLSVKLEFDRVDNSNVGINIRFYDVNDQLLSENVPTIELITGSSKGLTFFCTNDEIMTCELKIKLEMDNPLEMYKIRFSIGAGTDKGFGLTTSSVKWITLIVE